MATKRKLPAKRVASGGGASGRSRSRRSADNGGLTDDDLRELVPDGLAASFVKSKLHDKALAVAGLGEPDGWDGEMPELPKDIARH